MKFLFVTTRQSTEPNVIINVDSIQRIVSDPVGCIIYFTSNDVNHSKSKQINNNMPYSSIGTSINNFPTETMEKENVSEIRSMHSLPVKESIQHFMDLIGASQYGYNPF